MKTPILILVLLSFSFLQGQQIDYNTKKGIMAEGYDVVAYFEGKATKGSKSFTAQFDGVEYWFSTKENLERFKAGMQKYIPQYGGYCAYAIGKSGEKVGIDPETFKVVDGKLYLFYNSWGNNTLKAWNEEGETGLILSADKNWEVIKNQKKD